jgi:hypothetical protein
VPGCRSRRCRRRTNRRRTGRRYGRRDAGEQRDHRDAEQDHAGHVQPAGGEPLALRDGHERHRHADHGEQRRDEQGEPGVPDDLVQSRGDHGTEQRAEGERADQPGVGAPGQLGREPVPDQRDLQRQSDRTRQTLTGGRVPQTWSGRVFSDDEIRLFQALSDDPRQPASRLAEKTGLSPTTIRRRLDRLDADRAVVYRCEVGRARLRNPRGDLRPPASHRTPREPEAATRVVTCAHQRATDHHAGGEGSRRGSTSGWRRWCTSRSAGGRRRRNCCRSRRGTCPSTC